MADPLRIAIEAITNGLRPWSSSAWLEAPLVWVEDAARQRELVPLLRALLEQVRDAQGRFQALAAELERVLRREEN